MNTLKQPTEASLRRFGGQRDSRHHLVAIGEDVGASKHAVLIKL